ncbi:MAG: dihydrolipoyllysine-residue acetyltransferase [Rhizobacter sp.]|nr:dihydrolipoyllysine-residue acetyltransferase [Burkholderiales bacterium]
MATQELKVPDIGDFTDIPVIEILVKVGDTVAKEQSIVTLESDKATMEVPADVAGVIKELRVKLGDKCSMGTVVAVIEVAAAVSSPPPGGEGLGERVLANQATSDKQPALATVSPSPQPPAFAGAGSTPPGGGSLIDVTVPDIGDFTDIPVIEILVKVGDTVKVEQSLVTLESDKATMEVPSTVAGIVKEIKIKLGDKVSKGAVVVVVSSDAAAASSTPSPLAGEGGGEGAAAKAAATPTPPSPSLQPSPVKGEGPKPVAATGAIDEASFSKAHASPSIRKFARELGVDLGRVKATGPKNRVLLEDVQSFVKGVMTAPPAAAAAANSGESGAALGLLPWPKVDFTKFGEIESKPLSRIKKISGANLHRNWVMIPHVTNHDECDITELDALRVQLNKENEKSGIKVTMLAFVIKACVAALKKFPDFNASLDGDNLVYKKYFNIGFAADTPNGLVVPVLKNADQKGIMQIAKEMTELSLKAREGKLGPADMQGGCFSISSLGGIGGTAFSPIINAPEVAILGLSRGEIKPKWNGKEFMPKLMLPLSLSYDHRVIDGATAARFNAYLGVLLADFRRIAL